MPKGLPKNDLGINAGLRQRVADQPPDGVLLSVHLAHQLQEFIADNSLKPGERLPSERELSARYGVSRTVVRDALAGLEQRGVVVSRTGSGTYVRDGSGVAVSDVLSSMLRRDNTSLVELLDTRRLIEVDNAERAAHHAAAEHIAEMSEAIERMRASHGPLELAEADAAFHGAVSKAGGNRVLTTILGGLREMLVEGMVIGTAAPGAREAALREHAAILDAVKKGNKALARKRMTEHLAGSYREWVKAGFIIEDPKPPGDTPA